MQYIAVGDAAVAQFVFYKNGVPTTPSVAPTITAAYYPPNGTLLSPLPSVGSPTNPGEYTPQVFSAAATTAAGAGYYSATAYTSDTTMDNQVSIEEWTVGLNTDPDTIAAAVMNYLLSAVTTAGSWAKYVSDTLASILTRTASSGGPFVSPVADDGITTIIYVSRDYNSADGWALIYPTSQTVYNTDVFSWSVGPFGSPYLTKAGSYYDANHIQVELTAAQTGSLGKYIGQSIDLEIRTTRSTRKIEQVRGKAQIKGVVNP